MYNESVTIEKLTKGSKKAFQEVYNHYYEMLLYVSMQYVPNKEDAKEMVQDAFVKLWTNRAAIDSEQNIRNYLYTILKNNCLNFLKKQERIYKNQDNLRWMELHCQYEAMWHLEIDSIEFKELQNKIDWAISNLPKQCQEVFRMSRFSELKNREIAKELNLSEKTVESHITKSLKILKANLLAYFV